MALVSGAKFGPYEVVAPLGVGGMGEVYRARDTRLGREVALKVLPADVAANPDRRQRFELEARSASALSHPNILTVFDVGGAGATSFIVTELIEGESLRAMMQRGGVGLRKLLDLAVQIADGLAAAHGAGVVHRDLKPENVMVARDGRAKILDFGLARQTAPVSEATATMAQAEASAPGMIVGTASYMSPEQARGAPLDFRSDQFSFGLILYELAAGRHPFRRETTVETLTAILKEDAPPVESTIPLPLKWIIERCLSKDPEDRYASTRDLHRDLRDLREHLSEVSSSGVLAAVGQRPVRGRTKLAAAIATAGVVAALAGWWAGSTKPVEEPPRFQALTFRRGVIDAARFAPDGRTVVYGAGWGGEARRVYTTRLGSPESTALDIANASLFSVSSTGDLAVSLGPRFAGGFLSTGMLARAPLAGGSPREVLEQVLWADWSPDGTQFLAVRDVQGRSRLEFPIGKVLYETAGWISHPRISPKGDRIAFLDHPTRGDDGGDVAAIDLSGVKETLSEGWMSEQGLAWRPSGDEVWFTATRVGSNRALHAVTLDGTERFVYRIPGTMTLHDIFPDGRALVSRDATRLMIRAQAPGESRERDLSWLDWSLLRDISADGTTILFDETGEGGGSKQGVYIRRTDGSPAARLGDGFALSLSPDGKWALGASGPSSSRKLGLLPTGPGDSVTLSIPGGLNPHFATWFPDGRRMLLLANELGRGTRLYVVHVSGKFVLGKPRPIAPEGAGRSLWSAISRDSRLVVTRDAGGELTVYPVDGGQPRPLAGAVKEDLPVTFDEREEWLYVFQRPAGHVFRIHLASGRRELWREITPPDISGLISLLVFAMTPDGRAYGYTFFTTSSELYLAEGLK